MILHKALPAGSQSAMSQELIFRSDIGYSSTMVASDNVRGLWRLRASKDHNFVLTKEVELARASV